VSLAVLALISYPINALAKFTILHGVVLGAVFLLRRRIEWSMIAPAIVYWGGLTLLFLPNFFPLLDYAEIANRTYDAFSDTSPAGVLNAVLVQFPIKFLTWGFHVHLAHAIALLVARATFLVSSRKVRIAGLIYLVIAVLVGIFYSDLYQLVSDSLLAKMDLRFVKWALPFSAALFITVALSEMSTTARTGPIVFLSLILAVSAAGMIISGDVEFHRTKYLVGLLVSLFVVLAAAARRPEIWRLGRRSLPPALSGSLAVVLLAAVFILGQPYRLEFTVFDEELGPDPALAALSRQHAAAPFRVAVVEWHPSRAQFAGLETFGGASPVFSGRYRDYALRAAAPQFTGANTRDYVSKYWYHILMSDWSRATHLRAYLPAELTAESWNLRVLAAGNVRYILSASPVPGLKPAPGIPAGAAAGSAIRVYEVPEALPRAYLVPSHRTAPSGEALLDELASSSMATLRSTLWVEGEAPPQALEGASTRACGAVAMEDYTPDRITLAVTSLSPCYLVMVNNYDPRWSASVDGDPVPLFRANHAFQAVTLATTGDHRVEFRYQDRRFPLILLLIPLGALVIVLAPWSQSLGRRARPASKESGKASS
jgi:hypothetical protein